jgi:hypothetical protein
MYWIKGTTKNRKAEDRISLPFHLYSFLIFSVVILLFTNTSKAITRTSVLSGNCNTSSTWLPNGMPSGNDDVVIASGNTVTVTSSITIHNLTVSNGGLLKWSGPFKLTITGSITVNGKVEMNGGDLALASPGSAFTLGANSIFIWKPADNTPAGASLFINGIENFSSTSTLIIQKWYDYSVPLASSITGNFGNLELNSLTNNTIYEWNQNNQFETHKISGALTIDQGWITLDKSGAISNTTIGNIILKNANSSFYGHNGIHAGSFTITTSSITNNGGIFYGLNDGDGNIILHVTGDFTNLGNVKLITNSGMTNQGNGNATFKVDGTFSQSTGDTRILYNVTTTNSGLFTATFNKLNLTGGIFMAQTACRTSGGICSFTVLNDFNVNFSSASAKFRITSLSSINANMNNVEVNFYVGGNLQLSGLAASEFTSTASAGKETATIHGDLIIDGTDASFNYGTMQASHDNKLIIDGNVVINNGSVFLSRNNGNAVVSANGNLSIVSGTLSLKGGTGTSALSLLKDFSQTGGTFYVHNNISAPTNTSCVVNVSGDFNQSSGIFSFDNNSSNLSSTHILNLLGGNYNLSGGTVTHAGEGTSTVFGQLNFAANGTIQFKRTGNLITQVKQNIKNGCTLLLSNGNIQIASYPIVATDYFRVECGARLELKSGQVFSNGLFSNSGIQVDSAGVLAIQNLKGMYDGTANAAINANNNLNYSLHSSSIVEYNGNLAQILTGIGNGAATTTQNKYGILRINSATSVSLFTSTVFIRTALQLTKGELNLNGETITVENGKVNAITKTAGYIKSEQANEGFVCWKNIGIGNHEFPFGVSPTEYIPVTVAPFLGIGNDVTISTYSTPPDNQPYPNVSTSSLNFKDNNYASTDVIDRWWVFRANGIAANVTLTYRSNEKTLSTENTDTPLGIIQWNGSGWTSPSGIMTNLVNQKGTVTIKNASAFSAWTIAARNTPMPFQLASFNADQVEDLISIKWTTAAELNSSFFSVERSSNGIQFEEISQIKASGNSNSPLHYSSIDRNPLKGTAWYRLKQTDTGNKSVLSEARLVIYNESMPARIEIENFGPNPFEEAFQITYRINKDGLVRFQLCSSKGEILHTSESNDEKGSHRFEYDAGPALTQGIYFLKLIYYDKTVTQKIIRK